MVKDYNLLYYVSTEVKITTSCWRKPTKNLQASKPEGNLFTIIKPVKKLICIFIVEYCR